MGAGGWLPCQAEKLITTPGLNLTPHGTPEVNLQADCDGFFCDPAMASSLGVPRSCQVRLLQDNKDGTWQVRVIKTGHETAVQSSYLLRQAWSRVFLSFLL